MVTVISLPGQMVSVATAQLCHCSMKAVTGNREVSGHGCVSIKLYLEQQGKAGFVLWAAIAGLWLMYEIYYTPLKASEDLTLLSLDLCFSCLRFSVSTQCYLCGGGVTHTFLFISGPTWEIC